MSDQHHFLGVLTNPKVGRPTASLLLGLPLFLALSFPHYPLRLNHLLPSWPEVLQGSRATEDWFILVRSPSGQHRARAEKVLS